MSRKPSSSIADRKMDKSVGASTQPCLTSFVTPNDSETSHPTLTFAIIPVCSTSIIVVNKLAGKLADVEVGNWWCIQFEKQAEILIDKYYSCVKVIHKAVLDIH